MRILLLASLSKNKSGNAFGGAEKSIINLANWLSLHSCEVFLASVEDGDLPFNINDKVNFINYHFNKKGKIYTHYQIFRNTLRAIKESNPDVIISFWIHPICYAMFSSLRKNIITIYSERNDPNLEYSKISKILRNFALKRVDGIVFQTNEAKLYFNESFQKKSIIIHNPVYIKESDYKLPEKVDNRIVSVGRLNPQKNYALLIDTFNNIINKYPNLILEIYGEGPLRIQLQQQIQELKLEKKVFLMGTYKDIIDRIYGARLFVLPSIYEGMPNALMEAMCIGIPVVSSDCPCGGPKELIKNGINGYLFDLNNPDDLYKKMIMALENQNIDKLIKNEKKICNTHSQDIIFNQWLKFIKTLKR